MNFTNTIWAFYNGYLILKVGYMLLIMTAVFQTAVTLGMRLYAKGLESTPHCLGDSNPFNYVALDQRESHLPKSIQFWYGSCFSIMAGIFLWETTYIIYTTKWRNKKIVLSWCESRNKVLILQSNQPQSLSLYLPVPMLLRSKLWNVEEDGWK